MTDWSRCLWYESENKATFSSQNRNTWLISVEIWASLGLSAVLMKFTKILHAQRRLESEVDFSLGKEAPGSWGQGSGMLLWDLIQSSWGRTALHTTQWGTAQTGVWEFSPGYSKAKPTSHLISKAGAQTMGFHKPKKKDLELSFITQATSNNIA